MASKIIPLIPKHTVYVEPFAGGASIFFMKPVPKVTNIGHYREVINYTNGLVHNFYLQMRDNQDELLRLIALTPYSKMDHEIAVSICKKGCGDKIKLAWAFYVNINMSFSNQLNCGWRRNKFRRNSSFSWYSKIESILKFSERLKGVFIDNIDALDCIKLWDSPQTFFYCDPPYVNANQGHYSGYSQDDLEKLIGTLGRIKGSFILSGYNNGCYPDSWERFEFNAYSSAKLGSNGKNGKRKEIVLRKQASEPREAIKKIYRTMDLNETKAFIEDWQQ